MAKTKIKLLVILVFICQFAFSQKGPVTIDKQGTFKTLTRTDYIFSGCSFSKTDMTANFQEITRIIELTKQTPVIAENRGFMGFARLRPVDCKDDSQHCKR